MTGHKRLRPITGSGAPSEEDLRKLHHKHIIEGICLAISMGMISLCVFYFMDFEKSLWIPFIIAAAGILLNLLLAVRAFFDKYWLVGAGALFVCAACGGGLAYLYFT